MEHKKIYALLQLLDDTDSTVFKVAEGELKAVDISLLPFIESAIEQNYNNSNQDRFDDLLNHLRFRKTEESINEWACTEEKSLLTGWCHASSLQYYDLDFLEIEKQVQGIVKDVWLEINDSLTSIEKTSILNHIIFDSYKFEIDTPSPYEPDNFLISTLLSNKKGNQLSISLLYHLIAKRLLLPIFPISFNGNYLLGYYNPAVSAEAFGSDASPILFFINPGNKGTIIGYKEMDFYLKKENTEFKNHFMLREEKTIIKHLFYNLHKAYSDIGKNKKALQAQSLYKQLDQ